MPRFHSLLLVVALACLAPAVAQAQRVYWDPPGGRLGLGKTEPVSLVFEDCSPADNFRLPAITGLDFGEPSRSQQTSVINFQMSSRVVLTFPVRAAERGSVVVPAFDALTNKGKIAVGEVHFDVGEAGVGSSGVSIGDIVSSELQTPRTQLWLGQVVDFEYVLSASYRYNVEAARVPIWVPSGLMIEPFGESEPFDAMIRGERRQAVRYRTRGLLTQTGTLTPEPVRHLVNVQTGERAVGFFSQPRIEQFTVASTVPTLSVKPLPQPAPAAFRGAVGAFTLESTIVPQTARIGEPITWTLTLSGTGNWTAGLALPEREVSADFQVVQPKTRTEMEKGSLFEGRMIEDAVLVPTVAGSYSLGPVTLTHFDPVAGQYRSQTVPAVTVRVDPVPVGLNTAGATPALAPANDSSERSGLPGSAVASPPPPLPGPLPATALLPGDPLPVGSSSAVPRQLPTIWLAVVPLGAPLIYWLALAIAQAIRIHPARERRKALREMRRFLHTLQRRANPPDPASLERWRTLAARVWAIRRATPTVEDLAAAIASGRGPARPEDWLTLWREAELAMFSARATVPPDWLPRANATAASTRIGYGFTWWPARGAHWAPCAVAALAAALACGAPQADATEAREAYREGRTAEAREAWASHLQRQPNDWAAHYNLSLAASQLDAWAEAQAHAAAAFLLQPRSDAVRRQLRLTAGQLSGVDPAIRRVTDPAWHDRPVFWLSPGEWQNLIVGGAIVIGLALFALVTSLYLRTSRTAVRAAGQAMLVVGVGVLVVAMFALSRYGPLTDPRVAMVVQDAPLQSIPSDLADKQKSVPVPPGTIVRIERPFLGWDKVAGRSDSAGWIRREALVPFYFAPK